MSAPTPSAPRASHPGFAISALLASTLLSIGALALASPSTPGLQALTVCASGLALLLAGAAAWQLLRRTPRAPSGGMITICAWTRRVQWQGRWLTFEEYLASRFGLRCTHGISEDAAADIQREHARKVAAARAPKP